MNEKMKGRVQSFLSPRHSFHPIQLALSSTYSLRGWVPSSLAHARCSLKSVGLGTGMMSVSLIGVLIGTEIVSLNREWFNAFAAKHFPFRPVGRARASAKASASDRGRPEPPPLAAGLW